MENGELSVARLSSVATLTMLGSETSAPKQQNSFKQSAKSVAQLAALGAWGSPEPDSSAGVGNTTGVHARNADTEAATSHDHAAARQSKRTNLFKKKFTPISVLGEWGDNKESETDVIRSRGSSRGSARNLSRPGTGDRPGSSGRGWSRGGLQVSRTVWLALFVVPKKCAHKSQYDCPNDGL